MRDLPWVLGRLAVVIALGSAAGLTSCRRTVTALGNTPGEAQHRAGELIGSIAQRFGPTEHTPRFSALRARLARAALAPSRVYEDADVWTSVEGTSRGLGFAGEPSAGRYRLGIEADPARPTALAGYRGILQLHGLRSGEFEWLLSEELAVGPVSGEDLDRALTLLLLQAEDLDAVDPAVQLRAELPRTTRALGRLLSLDALRLSRENGDATTVTLEASIALEPGRAPGFVRYARFLEDHVLPLRIWTVARDTEGADWWEASLEDGRLKAQLRIQRGFLVPLEGRPRRLPKRLSVLVDLTTKAGLFRVGFSGLLAQVELVQVPGRRAFVASFRDEPRWRLPFLAKPLLRSSLRRPFEGDGARFEGAILDEGPQTLLVRSYSVAVKESWLVRWMGGLMGTAVGDFRRGAEQEADRFTGEAFQALRADLLDTEARVSPRALQ